METSLVETVVAFVAPTPLLQIRFAHSSSAGVTDQGPAQAVSVVSVAVAVLTAPVARVVGLSPAAYQASTPATDFLR